jgi:hypothetical protein
MTAVLGHELRDERRPPDRLERMIVAQRRQTPKQRIDEDQPAFIAIAVLTKICASLSPFS